MSQPTGERFRIRREAGRGKRAVVHEGIDTLLHRTVAVKAPLPGVAVRHVIEEAQRLARVRSPYVAQIYDFLPDDNKLILEWLSGQTLRAHLARSTPLPFLQVDTWTRQLLRATAACHAADILHGDIKPENIWIDTLENLRLFDLGATPTPGGDATALYAPGEILQGDAHSEQSDLYCVGSVVFELLTGRPPFDGSSSEDLARRKTSQPAPLVNRSGGTVSSPVEAWLSRALHRDASQRFESATAALEAWQVAAGSMQQHAEAEDPTSMHPQALETLLQTLPNAGGWQGDVVAITGPTGMGKSRLLGRLATHHATVPRIHLRGQAEGTVVLQTGNLPEAWGRTGSALSARDWYGFLSRQRQGRQHQDILVLVDDFDRCNAETRGHVVQLAQQATQLRVGLVVTVSPALAGSALDDWCALQDAATHCLHLSQPDVATMQRALAEGRGFDVLPDAMAAYVHALSGGSPRFADHILDDLEQAGLVRLTGSTKRFEIPSEDRIPARAMPYLQRALEQLTPAQRQLLVEASLQGVRFRTEVLAAHLHKTVSDLQQELHIIEQRSQLIDTRDPVHRFTCPLVRLFLENTLAPEQRRQAHARLAGWMRQQADADPAALGTHLMHAGDREAAHPLLLQAGRRALEQHELETARRHLHLALQCFVREPASEGEAQSLAELLLLQSQTLARLASWDDAFPLIDRCLLLAQAWGLQSHEVQAIRWRGRILYKQGRFDAAIATLRQAQEAAQRAEDAVEAHELNLQIGNIDFELGRLEAALEGYSAALLFASDNNDAEMEARASNNVALVYSTMGNKPEAIRMFTRALKVFRRLHRDDAVARIQHNIGMTYLDLHNWTEARNYFRDTVELSERLGLDEITAVARLEHAETNLRLGRIEEARPEIEKALALCEQRDDPLGVATAYRLQGMVAAQAGDLTTAETLLERSIDTLRDLGDSPHLGLALKERGRVRLESGDLQAARQSLEEARAVFESLETPHEALEEINALWETCQRTRA